MRIGGYDDDGGPEPDWPLPEDLVRRILRIVLRKTGARKVTAALAIREFPFMCVTEVRPSPAEGNPPEVLRYQAIPITIGERCIGSLGIQLPEGDRARRVDGVLARLARVLSRLVALG